MGVVHDCGLPALCDWDSDHEVNEISKDKNIRGACYRDRCPQSVASAPLEELPDPKNVLCLKFQ